MESGIREYKAEDSVAVKNFILSILKSEYPFDQSAYQDSDINDITGTYLGKDNAFFVIEKGGNIVGVVGIKRDETGNALVRRLYVSDGYRKKGLGTALLTKAIEFCGSKGYERITFKATDRMSSAMQLCKKLGFREIENLEVSGFHIHTFALKL